MTVGTLLGPLAAATVLNVFLFAAMWRGSQIEKRVGKPPLLLVLGLTAYPAALGAFIYTARGTPLASGFDFFMAGITAQAFGVLVVFAILHALYFSRGQRMADRAFAFVGALFLTGLLLAGVIAG